jgi:hypothetical protein
MAQSAVRWLEENINEYNWEQTFELAKAMEKEQIQKAFSDGQEKPINHPTLPHYSREEYYNETFGGL